MALEVLVTTGNGMFGRSLVNELAGREGVRVRAMVRDATKFDVDAPNVTPVVADMDDPATLVGIADGATHVFLCTPMDEHITTREKNVVDAVLATGTSPVVLQIGGAVKHQGDHLSQLHEESFTHLKESGLPWKVIGPNSVMETSLLPYANPIKMMNAIFGMSGHGKIGLVALEDVGKVMATVVMSGDRTSGEEFLITGPTALDLFEVADIFSSELGRAVTYEDMSEADFADLMMTQAGFTDPEVLEVSILCHLRAWGRGDASLVTDTVQRVTGAAATPLSQWVAANKSAFE